MRHRDVEGPSAPHVPDLVPVELRYRLAADLR
jgi:hypothetical protein